MATLEVLVTKADALPAFPAEAAKTAAVADVAAVAGAAAAVSAAVGAPAQPAARRALRVGDVVDGTCVAVESYGAMIQIDVDAMTQRKGLLHISEISQARIEDVAATVPVGAKIRCLVTSLDRGRVAVSTKRLEAAPGDMLRDPEKVYANAEANAVRVLVTQQSETDRTAVKATIQDTTTKLAQSFSLDDLDGLVKEKQKKKLFVKRPKAASPAAVVEAPAEAPAAAVSAVAGVAAAAAVVAGATAATVAAEAAAEETAPGPASALSLLSAFQPRVAEAEAARQEEFELLMRDIIYEPSAALGDVSKLLKGRKKRGSFQSPFWSKLFPQEKK
ncbi:hypothetical protein M885DRAFT_122995 [Pelagophyceae sp. CCMP2097]|nr:hypothetical protein M885DRAFT_122995 [Pelagophyceae sp. CCMP2097]